MKKKKNSTNNSNIFGEIFFDQPPTSIKKIIPHTSYTLLNTPTSDGSVNLFRFLGTYTNREMGKFRMFILPFPQYLGPFLAIFSTLENR
jgi:hypothetical protein